MSTNRSEDDRASHGRQVDEASLIRKVIDGDGSAARALYDAHVDRIYRLCYRMAGEDHLAQDFTQDAFVRAFGRLEEFRGDSSFGTWLYAIATSVALNGLRKRKRFREREVALEDGPVGTIRPGGLEPDLKERLERAIDRLPEGYRTVFLMHDLEGFTHEEIGAALGVQPGTSKSQLFRARAKLREELSSFAGEWAS